MLARLLLALFVLLAAPATTGQPACHEVPAMAGIAQHNPVPAKSMPADMCIGCIAPATMHPPVLTARILLPAPAPVTPVLTALAGARIPPATPPPRLG